MTIARFHLWLGTLASLLMLGAWMCNPGTPPPGTGGIIEVSYDSTVGVVLEDTPAGLARDALAAEILSRPPEFWVERATHQADYGYYRLTFRPFFYTDSAGEPSRGQLPLPPNDVWGATATRPAAITVIGPAIRTTTPAGLDVVQIDYSFRSYLVSDAASPALSDPALASVGGLVTERLELPLDPYGVAQRTTPIGSVAQAGGGSPCVDEFEYPPQSWTETNSWQFHDQECADTATYCHLSGEEMQGCTQAMDEFTGRETVDVQFMRVKYRGWLADRYRNFPAATLPGADLIPRNDPPGLDVNQVDYQYFAPNDCAIAEGCVAEPGWRRLMRFDSVNHNIGGSPMHIGDINRVVDDGRNFMEFHECHEHYHFNYYGSFEVRPQGGSVALAPGAKLSFCLESTNRLSNNESTPLVNEYFRCYNQGIESGWGDMYQGGLPCQWVDITDVDTTAGEMPVELDATANPAEILCEGNVITDSTGYITDWHDTTLVDHDGGIVQAPDCIQTPGALDNNVGSVDTSIPVPGESYITQPCAEPGMAFEHQFGPTRNCGFDYVDVQDCVVGAEVHVQPNTGGMTAPVIRICEKSADLGIGIPCTYLSQVAQTVGEREVTFTCPETREYPNVGGYSVYVGDVL